MRTLPFSRVLFASVCSALLLQANATRATEPPPVSQPFGITRLDPALDQIVSPDAQLELVGDRFGLVKGLQWVNDGNAGILIVSDLISNVLYQVAADGTIGVLLPQAGYSGKDITHAGTQTRRGRAFVLLVGSSCALLDSQGRLVWCANNDRTLMRLEKDGTRTVIANGANGKLFSGPNSVAFTAKGSIYLTDNDFGLRDAGDNPDKQLENAVWLLNKGSVRQVLTRAELGGIPDGIALSPNEKWLYLSANDRLKRYRVHSDGSLDGGEVIGQGDGIGDGIIVDAKGNVFSTGGFSRGRVRVMSAAGKLLGFLDLPVFGGEPKRQICSDNVAFGGADGKTLYIAACEAVFKLPLFSGGAVPGPKSIVRLPTPKAP